MSFTHRKMPAYKLNRDHCGLVVHVTDGDWTIVGTLNQVRVTLGVEYDGSPWDVMVQYQRDTQALRSGERVTGPARVDGSLWLHVGPWKGDIPLTAVATVEVPEKALPGPETVQGELLEVSLVEETKALPGCKVDDDDA